MPELITEHSSLQSGADTNSWALLDRHLEWNIQSVLTRLEMHLRLI